MSLTRDLTLADFVGLLTEGWRPRSGVDYKNASFIGTFVALPSGERTPERTAELVTLWNERTDPAYLIYLKQQFPSIRPREGSRYCHWLGEKDYVLMRTMFGGDA